MNKEYKIGASILSADFANLGNDSILAEKANVDYIHIDIMDGRFVEGITWGPEIITALKRYTSLPLDIHLMVEKPENFINQYISREPYSISIHPESTVYTRKILRKIKKNGIKAGVALKLETQISILENIIDCADYILLLTSEEGFGGNEISDISQNKIMQIHNLFKKKEIVLPIQLDGGIKESNIRYYYDLGSNYFVLGSAIFNQNNINNNVNKIRNSIELN